MSNEQTPLACKVSSNLKLKFVGGVQQNALLNVWKQQLPVTCQLYHLLHVRDCLINKNAKRPQVHLVGRRQHGEKLQRRKAGTDPGAVN